MSAALALENLSLNFAGKTVLRDFNLSVAVGEKVVLAGESGCGKSTVLALLLGNVTPDAGTVSLFGQTIGAANINWARRQLAWLPQEIAVADAITVLQWFQTVGAYEANQGLHDFVQAAQANLAKVNLSAAILAQLVGRLSAGEKQRAALALVLALARPILLLDEPTAALDSASGELVHALLKSLTATMLLVSHADAAATAYCQRRLFIPGGTDCLQSAFTRNV